MESLRSPVEEQRRSEISKRRDLLSQCWDGKLGGCVERGAAEEVEEREEEEGEGDEEGKGHLAMLGERAEIWESVGKVGREEGDERKRT